MLRDFVKSAMEKKNTVMFITSLVFITGIASYFNHCEIIAGVILSLAAIFLVVKDKLSYKLALFWIFIFYIGFFNASLRIHTSDKLLERVPENAEIVGRVITIPNSNVSDRTKFFFEVSSVNNEKVSAKTFVTVSDKNGGFEMLNIGNEYKIKGKLRAPFKASNPSQFDYGKYLRNFDTFTVFYAQKSDCVKVEKKLPKRWMFMQNLNDVRSEIISVHSKYLKSPNLEILGGIVFGDDAVAPPDYVKASFVNSGLLHILAASGMNVAFIFGFWFWIMTALRVPYKPRVISGMAVIVLYTLMTGLGPSVIRAALMILFVLSGKLIDRDSHSVSLLSFVAMLMLIYNPAFLNDVGFQLSFLVTFGIICTATILVDKFKGHKVREYIAAAVLIPVVAQIWVAPIQMFYFNTLSTYSVLANISIMPFLSVISFGGFVSSVLAIIKPIAAPVCFVADFILNFMLTILVAISNFFSHLPHSLIETTHPSVFQIILYYLIVLFITLMIKLGCNRRNVISLFGMIILLLLSTVSFPSKSLEVIAFDVGNADAFLVKTPQNKYIMIDTGKSGYNGGKSQSELIVRKYMKDHGLKNLELLIVTHFDNDHSGGAVDVMENLNVKTVYLNSEKDNSAVSEKIFKTIKTKDLRMVLAQNNKEIYAEKDFSVITYTPNGESDNEKSIITLLKYKDFEMLFMGDAGVEAFKNLDEKHLGSKGLPENIEVLKVGHHGAANVVDKSMLKSISPKVSLISTGINNYGHPNKVTLDTLSETDIFRTDKNNSIKISTDGVKYQLFTYDGVIHNYVFAKLRYCE